MTYGKLIRISIVITLLILALFIFFISGNHNWIEKNYSNAFFPSLSKILRVLFGWVPFSIGDIIYSVVTISVLWQIGKFIVRLFYKKDSWGKKLFPLFTAGIILLFVDKLFTKPVVHTEKEISFKSAIIIGFWQCLAMMPGTSKGSVTRRKACHGVA